MKRLDIAAIRARADADAEFCPAARTDVPALCDRVEALEAALREADRALAAALGTHGEPCSAGSDCQFRIEARAARVTARAALGDGE
jgi:hypothetical protein